MWKLELIAVDGSGETNVLIILYKTTLDYFVINLVVIFSMNQFIVKSIRPETSNKCSHNYPKAK